MNQQHPISQRVLTVLQRLFPAFLLLAGSLISAPVTVQAGDDKVITPVNTMFGTRGLPQTGSAEALGEGRVVLGVHGTWYKQDQDSMPLAPNNPNKGANLLTGIGSVAVGVSPNIDLFLSLSVYGGKDYTPPAAISSTGSGLGALRGGMQFSLPFNPSSPMRLAAQAVVFQGLSSNLITTYKANGYNRVDGYDYFETRKGRDYMVKLLQTMVFENEAKGLKLHVNEGVVASDEKGRDPLLLLSTGLQYNITMAAFGLDLNSRTILKNIAITTDPLWISPSVQFRTAYGMNTTLGADVSISQKRSAAGAPKALEPFRLFAGIAFSLDTQAEKRRRLKEQEEKEAMEKELLRRNNQGLTENLAKREAEIVAAEARQKAIQDSLNALMSKSQQDSAAMANKAMQDSIDMANKAQQDIAAMASKAQQDSIAAANKARQDSIALASLTSKAQQDSAAMANKAMQDSLALAESQKSLAEEKSKRSDAEKQLLSTGLLLLDAVYFETGKTEISINSKPYLNILAKMLLKYPKLQIEVSGHTDNVGGDAKNMKLSQGRAEAVQAYMISVAPDLFGHLTAKGYGLTQPKADNSGEDGRKLNRRTELQVLNKEVLKEYNPD